MLGARIPELRTRVDSPGEPVWHKPGTWKRWEIPAALLVFAALTTAFFEPVVLRGRTFVPVSFGTFSHGPYGYQRRTWCTELDVMPHTAVGMPVTRYAHAELKAGRWPWWCPYVGMGKPASANLIANLKNPLRIPLLICPEPWVFDIFILARFTLCGAFTYLLLRALHLSALAAWTGSVFHAFCPYFVVQITLWHLYVDMLAPLVLLALLALLRQPTNRRAVVCGVVLALLLLGGNPQPALLALLLVACVALLALGSLWRHRLPVWPVVRAGVMAAGIGVGLALPEILDFGDWLREARHDHSQAGQFALPVGSAVSLLFSRLSFVESGLFWSVPYPNRPGLGFLAWALLPCAFLLSGRTDCFRWLHWAAITVFAILVLKVFGGFGVVNWLGRLPLLGLVNWPKYSHLLYLAAAVAIAIGTENLRRRAWSWSAMLTMVGLVAGGVIAVYAASPPKFAASFLLPIGSRPAAVILSSLAGLLGMLSAALLVVLGLAWCARRRPAVLWLLPPLMFAELWWYAPRQREQRFDPYARPPYVEFLQQREAQAAEPFRVYGFSNVLYPQYALPLGLHDVRDQDAVYDRRYYMLMSRLLIDDDRENGYPAITSSVPSSAFRPILDLCNVRYIISETRLLDATPRFADGRLALYQHVPLFGDRQALYIELHTKAPGVKDENDRFWFDYLVPPGGGRLRFFCALRPQGTQVSDGVTYKVSARAGDEQLVLAQGHLVPGSGRSAYHRCEADLSPLAGQRARLTFQIEPGLGDDATADVAGFGDIEFVRTPGEPAGPRELRLVYEGEVFVYENPHACSRALLVGDWRVLSSAQAVLDAMSDPESDPRALALVEDPLARLSGISPTAQATSATGEVCITSYLPNRVEIDARAEAPCLLVLADTFHPRWRCLVDGRPTPILPAYVALRAVPLLPGRHKVVFQYVPTPLYCGAAAAAITALVALVLAIADGPAGVGRGAVQMPSRPTV